MPAEWALSIVVTIIKVKGEIRNCSCYRAVKLFGHGKEVVKRVLEKGLCRILSVAMYRHRWLKCKTEAGYIHLNIVAV